MASQCPSCFRIATMACRSLRATAMSASSLFLPRSTRRCRQALTSGERLHLGQHPEVAVGAPTTTSHASWTTRWARRARLRTICSWRVVWGSWAPGRIRRGRAGGRLDRRQHPGAVGLRVPRERRGRRRGRLAPGRAGGRAPLRPLRLRHRPGGPHRHRRRAAPRGRGPQRRCHPRRPALPLLGVAPALGLRRRSTTSARVRPWPASPAGTGGSA